MDKGGKKRGEKHANGVASHPLISFRGTTYFLFCHLYDMIFLKGARIYAQNAIREKNQALNYLRLASRLDAVASKVDTASRMNQVTKSMSSIVQGMDQVMQTMDMAKITAVMDKFEKQFEDLDVKTEYIEGAMNQTTTSTTPADQVDTLINQVAEEHGLEISEKLGSGVPSRTTAKATSEQDDLAERLAKLKAKV
jgi:charged multivesicular body protein 1